MIETGYWDSIAGSSAIHSTFFGWGRVGGCILLQDVNPYTIHDLRICYVDGKHAVPGCVRGYM